MSQRGGSTHSTSSDPKQGASSSAGSSSASPEYTPKLAQQFVTVLWKKVTGSVTDPKPTEPRTCFLPYLPEDNEDERIDAIESISDDVGILLKAKKAYFWSVVLHDANFSVMLDSFFRHCTREWDQQAAPVDASDNDSVEPRHLLMRRMFHLILRCTVSPAASHAWHVKNFLYDQRVLDFPRLLDFVAIYSTYSSSLASAAESAAILRALRRVITGLVRADPRYLEDWKRTIQSVVTLLSDAIPAQVAKLLKEVVVSAAVDPLRSSSDSAIDAAPRTLHDVVRYVNDILLSIASFAFIYPDACNLHNLTPSLAVSFIRAISAAHDVLLPGLSFLIDRAAVTDTDGVAELMVLGNQARRSALALAPLLLERCCLLEEIPTKAPQDREMHGELVYGILEAMLNSTSANTESHLPLPSEHLKSLAADLLHTISKDHPNHIVHGALLTNIDQRRAILIRLKQFAERLDADGLDVTRVEYVLASVKTIVGQLPERKRTVFSSSNTTTATKPSASASVSASEAWLSALKHTATVKEVFSDLGDGFVTLCLVHYKADPQQAISALLEETLPSNIKALSRTLTLEEGAAIHRGESSAAVAATLSQRKNVFDGDNFDLLSKGSASANDQANIILGKKNGDDWKSVMNDKSSLNSKVRESILYEDEPDDSLDDFQGFAVKDQDSDSLLMPNTNRMIARRKQQEAMEESDEEDGDEDEGEEEGEEEEEEEEEGEEQPQNQQGGGTRGGFASSNNSGGGRGRGRGNGNSRGRGRGGNAGGKAPAGTPGGDTQQQHQGGDRGRGRGRGRSYQSKAHNQKDRSARKHQL